MIRPQVRTFTYACVPVPLNGAEHSSQAFRMEHDGYYASCIASRVNARMRTRGRSS